MTVYAELESLARGRRKIRRIAAWQLVSSWARVSSYLVSTRKEEPA